MKTNGFLGRSFLLIKASCLMVIMAMVMTGCYAAKPNESTSMNIIDKSEFEQIWVYQNAKKIERMKEQTIVFANETMVGGTAGCNSYRGGYTIDKGVIKFGALASTMMACSPEVMEQELLFLRSLDTVHNIVRVSDTQLELRSPGGQEVMVFVKK